MTDSAYDDTPSERQARFYLSHHGWEIVKSDDLKEIWASPRDTHTILPLQALDDYRSLMAEIVTRVAVDEGRPEEDVAFELAWPGYDKMTARTLIDRETSAVGLDESLDLSNGLRDLVVASARAAERPERSYRGGWSNAVGNYYDQVKVVPPRPGSFVLRALLPINPEPPEDLLFDSLDTDRIRQVTRTMLSGVEAALDVARSLADGDAGFEAFEATVPQGVSADLLDALALLGGGEQVASAFEIAVAWTFAAPEPPRPPVRVPAGLVPVFMQGADYLRDIPDEATGVVTGHVVRLHREGQGAGEITVHGVVESPHIAATRSVKMELDATTYGQAISAHAQGSAVRVVCVLRHGGARLSVTHVEDFRLLAST